MKTITLKNGTKIPVGQLEEIYYGSVKIGWGRELLEVWYHTWSDQLLVREFYTVGCRKCYKYTFLDWDDLELVKAVNSAVANQLEFFAEGALRASLSRLIKLMEKAINKK